MSFGNTNWQLMNDEQLDLLVKIRLVGPDRPIVTW